MGDLMTVLAVIWVIGSLLWPESDEDKFRRAIVRTLQGK